MTPRDAKGRFVMGQPYTEFYGTRFFEDPAERSRQVYIRDLEAVIRHSRRYMIWAGIITTINVAIFVFWAVRLSGLIR